MLKTARACRTFLVKASPPDQQSQMFRDSALCGELSEQASMQALLRGCRPTPLAAALQRSSLAQPSSAVGQDLTAPATYRCQHTLSLDDLLYGNRSLLEKLVRGEELTVEDVNWDGLPVPAQLIDGILMFRQFPTKFSHSQLVSRLFRFFHNVPGWDFYTGVSVPSKIVAARICISKRKVEACALQRDQGGNDLKNVYQLIRAEKPSSAIVHIPPFEHHPLDMAEVLPKLVSSDCRSGLKS
ncbi:hypothetical protein WJX72_008779 [[Myrmecia] bisecta]|uniref:Uncharacterized protein n=1 Tax=[Myrmecia] bisecta TaxID=41462 RepID=A0AAW1PE76_9CHLO